MSNKFNEFGGGDNASVTNGSLDIYGFSLKAENLDANQPLKTNSDKQLVSTQLNISDVVNLQAELDSSIQNPNQSNLISDGVEVTTGNVLKTNTIEPTTAFQDIGVNGTVDITNTLKTNNIAPSSNATTCSFDGFSNVVVLGAGNNLVASNIKTDNIATQLGTGNVSVSNRIDMLSNDIVGIDNLDAVSITPNAVSELTLNGDVFSSGYVKGNDLRMNNLYSADQTQDILVQNNLNLTSSANIVGVGRLEVDNVAVDGNTIASSGFLEFQSGSGDRVNFKSDSGILSLENNNLGGSVNVELAQFGGTNFNLLKQTGQVDFCAEASDTLEFTTDCFGSNKKIILDPTTSTAQVRDYNLNMNSNNITNATTISTGILECGVLREPSTNIINTLGTNFINASAYRGLLLDINEINDLSSNGISVTSEFKMNQNDITNIRSMSLTATQYISRIEDMGTPIGNYYVIPDNTTWIIVGQITLQYGIEFGINCSLRGIDFSAQITFDETSRDCDIKAVDNNFYLSQLTIVDGGGRFTGNTTLVRGLLNAQNYNVSAPAPFYARNKRFKVTDVNILRPFKIGTIEGFGTLNITNNFFNGGGGLAGQATSYYTNEGISISDGLSLEFNNNKVVLTLGAQQASTLKQLNMKARVSSLLGFNAVTITGNIFHPRNSETGIDFDADSRTQLGNISGNVFIRTGGTSPLINYTDQTTYDNYNPLSIENYSINANTGVVDSEPNLKCGINDSQSISSATATLLEPADNADVEVINVSSRFAIQLDLTGVSVPFVANERITDTASGSTALILAVDTESGGNQSVYITDMSGKFDTTPTTFTSATGSATGGSLRWICRYCEKDPRKLVLTATFSVSVGNNKQYFVAPSMNGAVDSLCEVGGVSDSSGAGATISVVCSKRYEEGDKEQFYFRTADASAGNITKGIIIIK